MFDFFTDEARDLVADAEFLARSFGASHVGTEHLLMAALRVVHRERQSRGGEGYDLAALESALRARSTGQPTEGHVPFTRHTREVLEEAWSRGRSRRPRVVRVQEIWRAVLAKPGSGARAMLADLGIDVQVVRRAKMDDDQGPPVLTDGAD